ncbi:MAG: hypothetical protein IPL61_10990 [Myxococcales bacterium]|nr:hypothetical protein [Myxococcales bacterium]
MWWHRLDDPDEGPKLKVWHVLFVVTPLMLWLAWSSYRDFSKLEDHGGTLYVGRSTKLLYDLAGKWGVIGFPLVIAAVWIYGVVVTLRLHRRADELAGLRAPPPPPAPPPPDLPRAVATGVLPTAPRLDPLEGRAPAPAAASTEPSRGDGPRLLR